jgi:methionine synthase II (cobalamin-independent)
MNKLRGLATGIGSLPYKDAAEAVEAIFKYTPDLPYWPQLPKRNALESMTAQFSEGLPCLKVDNTGIRYNPDEKELEAFYEKLIANDIDYFKITSGFSSGLYAFLEKLEVTGKRDFIKCQVVGPFTFAASIKEEGGAALLHNKQYVQVIINGLMMKALWQIQTLEKFAKKIIIFIDEPYLGCFGSAYTPLNREDVIKGLAELSGGIKKVKNVLIGVHCCGNTDWSILTDIDTIDIISFDAFGFQDRLFLYAQNLKDFFKRGGVLCWGIVPTQEFSGKETPELLGKKLSDGINTLISKGISSQSVTNNLLISPSCGLGTLDIRKSEEILVALSGLSSLVRKSL